MSGLNESAAENELRHNLCAQGFKQVGVEAGVGGLFYSSAFVTEDEEAALVRAADDRAWKLLGATPVAAQECELQRREDSLATQGRRRVQNHGGLPHAKGMVETALPRELESLATRCAALELFGRGVRPNHVLVNDYAPGQGIEAHYDGPLFDPPRAVIVSLLSPAVMYFSREQVRNGGFGGDKAVFGVLLEARSCIVLTGAAYADFKHGIRAVAIEHIPKTECFAPFSRTAACLDRENIQTSSEEQPTAVYAPLKLCGSTLVRTRRVSLTFRRARPLKMKLKLCR